jgi:hypothetical protein
MFAAGAAGMPLRGCSRALLALGLGSCDLGLLDIVPRDLTDEVDEWIFTEVQKMDESGTTQSDSTTSLRLRFPCLEGKECQIASAWLELPPPIDSDTDEEELVLVVLKLTGLKQAETLTPSGIHGRRSRKKEQKKKLHSSPLFGGPVLSTVAEGDEMEESDYLDGYFKS